MENAKDMPNQPSAEDKKAYKFPRYDIIGQAQMHDGKQVMIMSEKAWDTYCW